MYLYRPSNNHELWEALFHIIHQARVSLLTFLWFAQSTYARYLLYCPQHQFNQPWLTKCKYPPVHSDSAQAHRIFALLKDTWWDTEISHSLCSYHHHHSAILQGTGSLKTQTQLPFSFSLSYSEVLKLDAIPHKSRLQSYLWFRSCLTPWWYAINHS